MSAAEFSIAKGPLTLGLRPAAGGFISAFTYRAADGNTYHLMRDSRGFGKGPDDARGNACYPLFPFSNRIANAKLHFDGEDFDLPVNAPPEPHCLHGDGCRLPWAVAEQGDDFATLTLESDSLGPPFDYAAKQHFVLGDNHLRVDLSMTNKGSRSMPAGMGLHPHFDKPPGTTLNATLPGIWVADESLIPYEHAPVPPELAFTGGRVLDDVTIDGNFTGWDGVGRIDWPDRPVGLEVTASDNLRNIVIYLPPGQPFFCFEPVSNANNAFNYPPENYKRDGVVVLQPGETMEASITFKAIPK